MPGATLHPIDLNAEAAKLTMFRGRTAQTTFAERKGSAVQLMRYRDGLLLLGKSAGTGHWETHPEDELVCVLDGTATLEIVQQDGLHSFALGAGMVAVVPPGVWHRFHSAAGKTTLSAVIPGDHIDLDVDDPRTGRSDLAIGEAARPPSIIDLKAEAAKLTPFQGMTPRTRFSDRPGSAAVLAPYRDGILFLSKWSGGTTHWESHPADELVWILDGTVTLDIVESDGPHAYALGAGKMVNVPGDAWHRFRSAEDLTAVSATVPGPHVEVDVDDPRQILDQGRR
jgi:quercetin dioxygenase-like cupin family protein